MYTKFVADIGGTHARFALVDSSCNSMVTSLAEVKVFKCADFTSPAETVMAYQSFLGGDLPVRACIAAAGPVTNGKVTFTNLDWTLTRRELIEKLQLEAIEIVNDFTAVAYSIDALKDDETRVLYPGNSEQSNGARVVIGAGTGLGVAGLIEQAGRPIVIESEGGHKRFAPSNKREIELLRVLLNRFEYISMEMLLSGPGIQLLHRTMAQINGTEVTDYSSKVISSRAISRADQNSIDTMNVYIDLLAGFCVENALSFQASGGVYLAGDILRSLEPLLMMPAFKERFLMAGPLEKFVQKIPVSLVLVPDPGLHGAAVCAMSIQ